MIKRGAPERDKHNFRNVIVVENLLSLKALFFLLFHTRSKHLPVLMLSVLTFADFDKKKLFPSIWVPIYRTEDQIIRMIGFNFKCGR